MHGQEGAVGSRLLVVRDVHTAKGTGAGGDVVAVDDMAVGEDVGEGAFLTKLAVSLAVSARPMDLSAMGLPW